MLLVYIVNNIYKIYREKRVRSLFRNLEVDPVLIEVIYLGLVNIII